MILHISCGFSYSSVYKNLFSELEKKGIQQIIYNPQHFDITKNNEKYSFKIYSNQIIKSYDKFLYYTKIARMKNDIESNIDTNKISLIHSHSLFSDGGVAYELYKKYNIPYLVVIRNTDINKYYKYAIYLKRYAEKILLHSEKIIFVSSSYECHFSEKYISLKNRKSVQSKIVIVNNGIDSFWLKNKWLVNRFNNTKNLRVLCVAVIDKNKNSLNLVKACNMIMNKHDIKIEVTLVGKIKDKRYFKSILKYSFVKHINYVDYKSLLNIYRINDIFAMPSINETFGLVYAEAISQGLPVIYTKRQGFDGLFKEGTVGYHVDSSNPSDIATKILYILKNYEKISNNCINLCDKFSWDKPINNLMKIYDQFLFRGDNIE